MWTACEAVRRAFLAATSRCLGLITDQVTTACRDLPTPACAEGPPCPCSGQNQWKFLIYGPQIPGALPRLRHTHLCTANHWEPHIDLILFLPNQSTSTHTALGHSSPHPSWPLSRWEKQSRPLSREPGRYSRRDRHDGGQTKATGRREHPSTTPGPGREFMGPLPIGFSCMFYAHPPACG